MLLAFYNYFFILPPTPCSVNCCFNVGRLALDLLQAEAARLLAALQPMFTTRPQPPLPAGTSVAPVDAAASAAAASTPREHALRAVKATMAVDSFQLRYWHYVVISASASVAVGDAASNAAAARGGSDADADLSSAAEGWFNCECCAAREAVPPHEPPILFMQGSKVA